MSAKPRSSYIGLVKIVGALLSVLLVIGCSKPAGHLTQAGPAAIPSTWQLAKNEKYDVSIGYPPGWHDAFAVTPDPNTPADPNSPAPADPNAPPSDNSAAQAFGDLAKSMEASEKKQLQLAMDKEGILLMVNDGSKTLPGEEANQYVLKHKTQPGPVSLDAAEDVARTELLIPHEPEIIDTPLGKAAKFTSNYKDKMGDSIHMVAVAFADGNEAYVLKFSCTGDNNFKTFADQAIQSLRIKPGIVFPTTSDKE